jgi:hypothetical protein
MNHRTFLNHYCLSVALLVFTFAVRPANATSIPITGSYELIQKTNLGSQTKITVRFHLTNRRRNLAGICDSTAGIRSVAKGCSPESCFATKNHDWHQHHADDSTGPRSRREG